jgi:hypothetical protein
MNVNLKERRSANIPVSLIIRSPGDSDHVQDA